MSAMAAAAIFDQPMRPRTRERERALLTAAAGFDGEFTIRDLAKKVHPCDWRGCELSAAASRLLRVLRREGHVVLVGKAGRHRYVYRWVES